MARRGRPPKKTMYSSTANTVSENVSVKEKCVCCGRNNTGTGKDFYRGSSSSPFFPDSKMFPICKSCLESIYLYYVEYYKSNQIPDPSRKAIMRICMAMDIYYGDNIYDSALKKTETKNISVLGAYLQIASLSQNKRKNFDSTMLQHFTEETNISSYKDISDTQKVKEKTVRFFGVGFSEDDYIFLQEQYDDWTTRHECKTKAQEEVFKQICLTQLELQKATRTKSDTKDLMATFQKLLETAHLQPKQNTKDALSDTQTFGTLIEKWETTRPIPEVDEDLRDVDKIGLYLDVFFKGHLAKMMGLKNGLSRLYDKYMKKYTVDKSEYSDEEDSEALFDAVFGNSINEDD